MSAFDEYLAQTQRPYVPLPPAALPVKKSSALSVIPDIAISGVKGLVDLGQGAVGLADIVSGGYVGKGLQAIGFEPEKWNQGLSSLQSAETQRQAQELADTKGFFPTAGYVLSHPRTAANLIAETLPAMYGAGIGTAKVLGAAAPKLAEKLGPAFIGNIGEGVLQSGQMAEQIRAASESGTLTPGQIGASLASGAIDTLIGRKSGKVAEKLGLPDIQTWTGGGKFSPAKLAEGVTPPGLVKRTALTALNEGILQELPQSAQEQIWQNAATGKPLSEGVVEAAAQGMVLGGIMGGGFGAAMRRKNPADISTGDLQGIVDQSLAPTFPTEPAAPMQAEWDQMVRQQELNAARPVLEQGVPAPFADLGKQNDVTIQATEYQDRMQAVRDTLAELPTDRIEQALNTLETSVAQGTAPASSVALMGAMRDELESRAAPVQATQENVIASLFPEDTAPDVFPRTRTYTPDLQDEVTTRLQAAQRADVGNGQAASMAQQLPSESPIQVARGGTPVKAVPPTVLKGMPAVAKTELTKHLDNPERLAAAVADMFYTKAGQGSSAAYVLDKLPALYQQLTGQALPETPASTPPITATAAPFELQGETPEQAAQNYVRQQELEAAQTPLPDVTIPPEQTSFLTPKRGLIKATQASLTKQEQARQKAVATLLGRNIPEVPDAVQEPSTERLDVQQPAQVSQKVAARNPQGDETSSQGQTQVPHVQPELTSAAFVAARDDYGATADRPTRAKNLLDVARIAISAPTAQLRKRAQMFLKSDEADPTEVATAKAQAEAEISGKFSVQAAPEDGMAVKDVQQAISKLFAGTSTRNIQVVATEDDLPQQAKDDFKSQEQNAIGGFFEPKTGKVYIVANNMRNARAVTAVVLHEAGVHLGMKSLLGMPTYNKLISQLEKWSTNGSNSIENRLARRALRRVNEAVRSVEYGAQPDPDLLNEEMLAYFVEEAVNAGIDPTAIETQPESLREWFTALWRAVQQALNRLNILPAVMSAKDVVDLAYGAAHLQLNDTENISVDEPGKFSVANSAAADVHNQDVRSVLGRFGDAVNRATEVLRKTEQTDPQSMSLSVFKNAIAAFTKEHMKYLYNDKLDNGLVMNISADEIQDATSARLNQMFNDPYFRFEGLERSDPELAAKVGQLMQATEFQIDPRKPWEEHTHLHKLTGDQLDTTKAFVAQYRQMWGKLSQMGEKGKDAQKLYTDLANMNELMYTAQLSVLMYNTVQTNPVARQLPVFSQDPTAKFRQSPETHNSIPEAKEYWRDVMDSYVAALETMVAEQRGRLPHKSEADPEYQKTLKKALQGIQNEKIRQRIRTALRTEEKAKLTEEQRKILEAVSPIEEQLHTIEDAIKSFERAPYFHLGRFGDNYVSFRVRMQEGDLADPVAMRHVQEVLGKQFGRIVIRPDATDPHVFARFESVGEADEFLKALYKLQDEGWLVKPGEKDKNNKDLGAIEHGTREQTINNYHTAGPNWLNRVVEGIQAQGYDDHTEAQFIAYIRSLYLDSLPDTAAVKVAQKRQGRPGWDSDMIRSYAHRMRISVSQVALAAAEPTRTNSIAVMKNALENAKKSRDVSQLDYAKRAAVVTELEKRHADQMNMPKTPVISMLRAINHAYFLGLSPSYVLVQMTQLGALTLPELAKKHGYVRSMKAIGSVTAKAFKIMRVIIDEGYKQRGVRGAADMVITKEALDKAGLSKEDTDFVTGLIADNLIDLGNAARNIGRVSEGEDEGAVHSKAAEALRLASSFGYASEIVTRLITGLAAKELHRGPGLQAYAKNVINQTMFNYSSNNTGRAFGKKGVVGPATPAVFSFMQYQFQLLEKLYREFHDAYVNNPDLSPTEQARIKKESREFLKAHIASMLLLAGTMGLPFASVIATAMDKLCDMFSDGDCNTLTGLRNMTADVFGHDIEPLISRGILPRAGGFDISERVGEGEILPFSRFLADRRAMEDRLKDLALSSWGAPTSMLSNMVLGMQKIGQGDYLAGLQQVVPNALKGPLKAYDMTDRGYVDKNGNALPMSPGAWDIMLQTLGLNPGIKADYQQARFAQLGRSGEMSREASRIRQRLAAAIERGDAGEIQRWRESAQEFDRVHPVNAILPSIEGTIRQRAQARAFAASQGGVMGVSPKDYSAQQFTRFFQP